MHVGSIVAAAVTVVTVIAKGFVYFDVEKRGLKEVKRIPRRRDTNPIYSQLLQNPGNFQEYLINCSVGTPGQQVGVTLDTGSSDLWVPSVSFCNTNDCDFGSFDPSRSSTYETVVAGGFNITYAAPGDSDAGDWSKDSFTIGGAPVIQNQTFGLANDGYDSHGVLGIGYDSHETGGSDGDASYPSVMDNLVQYGLINRKAYSLYLNSYSEKYGSIVFGGVDPTKYTGDLVALPLQPEPGGGGITGFFVTLSKVTFTDAVGTDTVLTPDGYAQSVLLDSGTSYTALTNDLLERLTRGMGAVEIEDTGSLSVPCHFRDTNATINYTFGGSNGVTVKVPVSETIGAASSNECSFGFGQTIGGISVLGDTFLRSAYAVFDIDNQYAALAQAVGGQTGTAGITPIPTGTAIPGVTSTAAGSGTQLDEGEAMQPATLVTASSHHSSIIAGSPTFFLGAAATRGVATFSSVAKAPQLTGLPQAALLGAGFVAGAIGF